jgi:hypothetical protein
MSKYNNLIYAMFIGKFNYKVGLIGQFDINVSVYNVIRKPLSIGISYIN